jgi:hypothetical protein
LCGSSRDEAGIAAIMNASPSCTTTVLATLFGGLIRDPGVVRGAHHRLVLHQLLGDPLAFKEPDDRVKSRSRDRAWAVVTCRRKPPQGDSLGPADAAPDTLDRTVERERLAIVGLDGSDPFVVGKASSVRRATR